MTCEDWQGLILDQESLNDLQQRELRQHLSKCMDCRAWAEALAEADATLTEHVQSEANPSRLGMLVLRAVAEERRQRRQAWQRQAWMASAPELLDGLGWGAVGALGMTAFMFWMRWSTLDNHLVWMGAAAVAGSVAWAGGVLRKEKSEAGLVL